MVIYKITNSVNNKVYIGKTICDKDDYFGSGVLIKQAIKKYGLDKFAKEIIDTANSIEELNNKEKYWIAYFNSCDLNLGYNIGLGGDGGDLFSNNPNKEAIRLKYSKPKEKNPMFGKHHNNESINKISHNRKGKNKGLSTWNKGISIKEYSEKYMNCFNNRKGSKNPNSKMFLFISPDGIEFKIIGNYETFCIENNLDVFISRHFINKGKIPKPQKGIPKTERLNLIGWEIIRL